MGLGAFSIVPLALTFAACASGDRDPVEVRNACNTFVSEFAPRRTPELRHGKNGLELIVSFTPDHDPEAEAVFEAARRGPAILIVYPSMQRVQALGEEGGYLVLSVQSEADAKRVQRLLCF
jgi:hypothetical protein